MLSCNLRSVRTIECKAIRLYSLLLLELDANSHLQSSLTVQLVRLFRQSRSTFLKISSIVDENDYVLLIRRPWLLTKSWNESNNHCDNRYLSIPLVTSIASEKPISARVFNIASCVVNVELWFLKVKNGENMCHSFYETGNL